MQVVANIVTYRSDNFKFSRVFDRVAHSTLPCLPRSMPSGGGVSKFTVVIPRSCFVYYIQCTYVCIYYYNRFHPAYAIAVVGFAGALVYYIYIIYGIYVRIFEGVVPVGGAGRSIAAPRTFYRLASGDGKTRGGVRVCARARPPTPPPQRRIVFIIICALGGDGATRDNDTAAATHTQ